MKIMLTHKLCCTQINHKVRREISCTKKVKSIHTSQDALNEVAIFNELNEVDIILQSTRIRIILINDVSRRSANYGG